MTLYSYIVRYDHGFAPNPFHGVCTLACCKPVTRRVANVGDYIVGLTPKHPILPYRVVYAMQVSETMSFEDYWRDPRFLVKRPNVKTGGEEAVGDNIYHPGAASGSWIQERSHHTEKDIAGDTKTDRVLIGMEFTYWGGSGPPLPYDLKDYLIVGRNHRPNRSPEVIDAFVEWFNAQERGRLGMPANWSSSPSKASCRPRRC